MQRQLLTYAQTKLSKTEAFLNKQFGCTVDVVLLIYYFSNL